MNIPYSDIINLPHHVSHNHPQMSMHDRAAQFSPFAALTGYEDAIDETARLTDEKPELGEVKQAELNQRISFLMTHNDSKPEVVIEYFVPDERKSGGTCKTIHGSVRKFSLSERTMTMHDGIVMRMDDIISIAGEIFDGMDASHLQ